MRKPDCNRSTSLRKDMDGSRAKYNAQVDSIISGKTAYQYMPESASDSKVGLTADWLAGWLAGWLHDFVATECKD